MLLLCDCSCMHAYARTNSSGTSSAEYMYRKKLTPECTTSKGNGGIYRTPHTCHEKCDLIFIVPATTNMYRVLYYLLIDTYRVHIYNNSRSLVYQPHTGELVGAKPMSPQGAPVGLMMSHRGRSMPYDTKNVTGHQVQLLKGCSP